MILAGGVAWRGLPLPDFLPIPRSAELALLAGIPLFFLLLGLRTRRATQTARIRLQEELEQSSRDKLQGLERELQVLQESCSAATRLVSPRTREDLAERVCRIGREVLEGEQVSVMLLDPETEELTITAALGHPDPTKLHGIRQHPGDGIAGWVAEHRRPLLLGPDMDPKKFWRFKPKPEAIHAAMVVPLVHRDRLLGVINVSRRATERTYGKQELRALQVIAWTTVLCLRLVELEEQEALSESTRQAS
jgi:signal transduction protein with GAF and PtsI domain